MISTKLNQIAFVCFPFRFGSFYYCKIVFIMLFRYDEIIKMTSYILDPPSWIAGIFQKKRKENLRTWSHVMFPNNFEKSRHLATIAVKLTLIEPRHAPPPLSQVNMKWAYFFLASKWKGKPTLATLLSVESSSVRSWVLNLTEKKRD